MGWFCFENWAVAHHLSVAWRDSGWGHFVTPLRCCCRFVSAVVLAFPLLAAPAGAELRVLHAHEADAAQGAPFPLDAGVTLALKHSGHGGFGSAVLEALAQAGVAKPVRCLALPSGPIEHGDPDKQRAESGLDVVGIAQALRALAGEAR